MPAGGERPAKSWTFVSRTATRARYQSITRREHEVAGTTPLY